MPVKKLETSVKKRKQVSKMQTLKKKSIQRVKKIKICDHVTDSALPKRSVKLLREIVDVLAENRENTSEKQKKENSQLSKRLKKALKDPKTLKEEKSAKPKKPANSFIRFVQSRRPKEGKYSVTELTKDLAKEWKTMSQQQKDAFKKMKPKKKIIIDDEEELPEDEELPKDEELPEDEELQEDEEQASEKKPKLNKKQLVALIKKNGKSDLSSAKLQKMRIDQLQNLLR